ncbi:MAG: sulfotransferase [Phycisphaerae bacterium]
MRFIKNGRKPATDRLFDRFGPDRQLELLCENRLRHVVPIRQPLVLISQIQRSGGTLLSQLFDGHPQVHAHPSEIYIGRPKKWNWPDLDLSDEPGDWFESLYEVFSTQYLKEGYYKYSKAADEGKRRFPFLFLPYLQRQIFVRQCQSPVSSQRNVLDAYFTSYFNAWLDYQALYQPGKIITGFIPRINMVPDSVQRFFRDYPDGKMISIIRDPVSWYASAGRHAPNAYPDVPTAIERWRRSTLSSMRNNEEHSGRVLLICFEELLNQTRPTMEQVARFTGIRMCDELLSPTFQGMSITADSSWHTQKSGVLKDPIERGNTLSSETVDAILNEAGSLYDQAVSCCVEGV